MPLISSMSIGQLSDIRPHETEDCSLKIEEWMTTEEAAAYLKIPKKSLLNLSSNGKVPYYKFQRRNRYLKSDLLKLLTSSRQGGFNGN
ncbi:MAG: hypothetical protein OM95_14655 [Bdellovibrio sp. ArHS]|uniref:helix-turn-helix domain-containing protein n=1 Tax=Bdellovibrio sp. ArHS TaxID=1569284 RepID=UPI000582F219|nr:MAG: hypothetical protein OM95_14655 [Bdellovibrio sp. ArHS]